MPAFLAFSLLVFGTALLTYEHFNGGVQSHHLLDRRDLPAISNWSMRDPVSPVVRPSRLLVSRHLRFLHA